MRDRGEAACGTQNPLVKLPQQLRGDVPRQQDEMAPRMSPLEPGPSRQAPVSYDMSSLLQEAHDAEKGTTRNVF